MFVQIIQGRLNDPDLFQREAQRWLTELKPGAIGYLGDTWGVTADGTAFLAARFESAEAAKANSERPEQGAWWTQAEKAFDSVTFHDCTDVDLMMGGGSNDAGFVQVIEGRAKDRDEARSTMSSAEGDLANARPDVLGGIVAWHGDSADFTQIMYFTSEDAARGGEQSARDDATYQQYQDMMAIEPTFLDLTEPQFD